MKMPWYPGHPEPFKALGVLPPPPGVFFGALAIAAVVVLVLYLWG